MQKDIHAQPNIQVTMLGEFSITINGSRLTDQKGRTKRVWMLIEYLLANRRKDVSMEMLAEVLWEEDECGDPMNALKNLVYRARQILKEASPDDKIEFIKFVRNTYTWNNDYDCVIDTEQLAQCRKMVNDLSKSDEVRLRYCEEALALYRGEFLPKSSCSLWVISAAAHYAALYSDCILNGCSILTKNRRFEEVIRICETALTYIPLEESVHKMLLYAYINTNQRSKALSHFNDAEKLFYKELGIDLTQSLQPVYRQLINGTNHIKADMNVIRDDLSGSAGISGAYYCSYEVFKSIYQIEARARIRTGISIFIVLFTLGDFSGEIIESDKVSQASGGLKEAILSSLRKGDIVTSYSPAQFIVMLTLTDYEKAEMVTNRILMEYERINPKNGVKIATRINALEAVK